MKLSMKLLTLILLVSINIAIGQSRKQPTTGKQPTNSQVPSAKGEPTSTTTCNADCGFTSCTITCSHTAGGAVCACPWGFAACACGGASPGKGRISVSQKQLMNLEKYREEILVLEDKKAATNIIRSAIKLKDFARKNRIQEYYKELENYKSIIERLTEKDKSIIEIFIKSISK